MHPVSESFFFFCRNLISQMERASAHQQMIVNFLDGPHGGYQFCLERCISLEEGGKIFYIPSLLSINRIGDIIPVIVDVFVAGFEGSFVVFIELTGYREEELMLLR